jgi:hypothetical protein
VFARCWTLKTASKKVGENHRSLAPAKPKVLAARLSNCRIQVRLIFLSMFHVSLRVAC